MPPLSGSRWPSQIRPCHTTSKTVPETFSRNLFHHAEHCLLLPRRTRFFQSKHNVLSVRSSVLMAGSLYTWPTITGAGSNGQNMRSVLATQISSCGTRVPPSFARAPLRRKGQNKCAASNTSRSFLFLITFSVYFMISSMHRFTFHALIFLFRHTRSKIPVNTLAPRTPAAMAVQVVRGTGTSLIVIHLSRSTPWITYHIHFFRMSFC